MEELKLQSEAEAEELAKLAEQDSALELVQKENRAVMARMRQADTFAGNGGQAGKRAGKVK